MKMSHKIGQIFGRAFLLLLGFLLTTPVFGFTDKLLETFIAENRAPAGSPVEVGVWNGDWKACKAKAEKEGIPMLIVWSNAGCFHCQIFEHAISSDVFKEWAKTCGYILCFKCSLDADAARQASECYTFCKQPNGITDWPFCRFYWPAGGVNFSVVGDRLDHQQGIASGTYNKAGQYVIDYIQSSGFEKYVQKPSFLGGTFAFTNTASVCLQAEPSTKIVEVPMRREATEATKQVLVMTEAPAAKQSSPSLKLAAFRKEIEIDWAKDETNKFVCIENFDTELYSESLTYKLEAMSEAGEVVASTTIACVPTQPNSSINPFWIGERGDESSEAGALMPGDWTMDIDLAKKRASALGGYTLVCVQGSLWCGDCANTEKNFLGLEDEKSENLFKAWAASKNVMLVAVDVPTFTGPEVTDYTAGSLLTRDEFTNKAGEICSGLNYMSRKGITAEAASAQFAKFHDLVTLNTDEGGFHRPEDANSNRMGVPTFVMLRADGTVAARLKQFSDSKIVVADSKNFDNYIKRFEEMLAIAGTEGEHADAAEIENNYPGKGAVAFAANGGSAEGELSASDLQDAFKLDGIGGNALQKIVVTGESDVDVVVMLAKLDAEGALAQIGTAVTNKLSAGVTVEETFTEVGDYYVVVSIADAKCPELDVANSKDMNFIGFKISGATVFEPQDQRSVGSAPKGSDKVTMRLEKDTLYRIEGLIPGEVASSLQALKPENPYNIYYTALATGDFELTCQNKEGSVIYQKWHPGTVGFAEQTSTAKESAGTVAIKLARKNGKSGKVVATVTVDAEKTTLINAEGENRYEFETTEIVWEDGDDADKEVEVKLLDDVQYDGDGVVALLFAIKEIDEESDTVTMVQYLNHELTVTEDDKAAPGVVAFAEAGAMLVKAGQAAVVNVIRTEASDGEVSVQVKTTKGTLSTNEVAWANHKTEKTSIELTGLNENDSATVSLASPKGGLLLGTAKTLKVTAVAADGLEFVNPSATETLWNNVAFSNVYALAAKPKTAKPTFSLIAGKLPAGLKVTYNAADNGMAVWGVPTKAGDYEVVYQVKDGKANGLAQRIAFTVKDPTDSSEGGMGAIPIIAGTKKQSLTFTDMMVIDSETKRLMGVLTLTVPVKGKLSGKYTCSVGTISFSCKNWSSLEEDATMVAELTGKNGYAMVVKAKVDGTVTAEITLNGELVGQAESDGRVWDATNTALAWKGYYTVVLPMSDVQESEKDLAPRGSAYLTLKMDTDSAAKSGTVTWAGVLPNGVAVSGKGVLTGEGDSACVPFFKKTSTEIFSGAASILKNAFGDNVLRQCVTAKSDVIPTWDHIEKVESASYTATFELYGAYYDKINDNLLTCCMESYSDREVLDFNVDADAIGLVNVSPAKIAIDSASNPNKVTLSFNDKTGIIKGAFKNSEGVTRNYVGVVLLGWGGIDCGCGEVPIKYQPFAAGSYYYSEKMVIDGKSLTVKRGGSIAIDASKD